MLKSDLRAVISRVLKEYDIEDGTLEDDLVDRIMVEGTEEFVDDEDE